MAICTKKTSAQRVADGDGEGFLGSSLVLQSEKTIEIENRFVLRLDFGNTKSVSLF